MKLVPTQVLKRLNLAIIASFCRRIANCEVFSSSNFLTKVCTVLVCSGYCSGFSVNGYYTVFRDLSSLNRNIVTIAKNSLTESLLLEGTVDVSVPFANQH